MTVNSDLEDFRYYDVEKGDFGCITHPQLHGIGTTNMSVSHLHSSLAIAVVKPKAIDLWLMEESDVWSKRMSIQQPYCCPTCQLWPGRTDFSLFGISDAGIILEHYRPGHVCFYVFNHRDGSITQLATPDFLRRPNGLVYVPNSLKLHEITNG